MSPQKLRLDDLRLGGAPEELVTVAEYDVTPGLHEWIESEIRRREQAAHGHQQACGAWEYDHCVQEIRDLRNAGTVAAVYREGAGEFMALKDPDDALRRCAADRKILAAHECIPHDPRFSNGVAFGCGTCHKDGEGYEYAGGNCATVLALAEAYGLDEENDAAVETVHD
ncbi:DUF6221 family protein [Streptomyces sp. NPDC102415]|uniref:DUF6221 family protein n=1 Tax=Streptomyces sp. NPDC102415 TaxID=3366173 RepID=UPI003807B798